MEKMGIVFAKLNQTIIKKKGLLFLIIFILLYRIVGLSVRV